MNRITGNIGDLETKRYKRTNIRTGNNYCVDYTEYGLPNRSNISCLL